MRQYIAQSGGYYAVERGEGRPSGFDLMYDLHWTTRYANYPWLFGKSGILSLISTLRLISASTCRSVLPTANHAFALLSPPTPNIDRLIPKMRRGVRVLFPCARGPQLLIQGMVHGVLHGNVFVKSRMQRHWHFVFKPKHPFSGGWR